MTDRLQSGSDGQSLVNTLQKAAEDSIAVRVELASGSDFVGEDVHLRDFRPAKCHDERRPDGMIDVGMLMEPSDLPAEQEGTPTVTYIFAGKSTAVDVVRRIRGG